MTSSTPSPQGDGDNPRQAWIYGAVIVVEIITILLLWELDRYFGG